MEHERSTSSEKTWANPTDRAPASPANEQDDLHRILDAAAVGLSRCSRDLRYLECNRAYERLTGLSRAQIIGRPIADMLGAKAFEVIRPYVERVLRGERVEYEEEVPVSLPVSGDVPRFFHVVYEPWFDGEGRITGFFASVSEITDLKRTTKALHESEERLRLAMSSGAIGVWDRDVINNRITWSPELLEIYGVKPGAMRTYEDFRSLVHPDDLAPMESERDAGIRDRRQFNLEFRIVRPSGEIRWVTAKGRGYYDENGRVVRVIGNNIDITERIQAKEALQEREQRLRLALDASAGGSWTWDIGTNRVDWDDRFREIYGFAPDEVPTFDAWFSRVHAEDRQRVLGLHNEILHTNKADGWDHAFRIVRPDRSVLWIESRGRVEVDARGHAMRLTGLELDVTERRRAEEALQARRDEERERALHRQAEEALRRSHADLERSHAELEESHAELEQRTLQLRRLASQLTLAEQSARRQLASTLHDGLQQLLFSAGITLDEAMKANSQDQHIELLQRVRADVKEAVEAARMLSVNLFPPILHLGGLPAALSWLAKRTQQQYNLIVNVTADRQANPKASEVRILLFEAVRELLFNAVKHAGIDRVDLNLALGPDGTIRIQVSDDGVGFDPSATLHDRNQAQGGLGLFSIQERLALLGGHLDIQSAPGKGARFTLTLPQTGLLDLPGDRTTAQRRDAGWVERLVHDSAKRTAEFLRILIADDHVIARAGLREVVGKRTEFWIVGEAASGVEAITQAVTLLPHVIIMDVSMHQMDGIEATAEIHRILPQIQIVGLSTHDDASTERLMREAGAEAYFTKNEGTDRLIDYLLSRLAKAKRAC